MSAVKCDRRGFLTHLGMTGVGMAAAITGQAAAGQQRPNILFLFSDDHAYQAISAYGSKVNKTPQLDRIARDGALFENCFCTNSLCAPSRAVVLTGKYSHLNGVRDNRGGTVFDGSQQTFPKLLQAAGYHTAMVGKWHLKSEPTGFDYWQVLPGQGNYYNPDFLTPQGRKRYPGYVTEITTDLALNWLKQEWDQSKPFLLHCWHKAPHRPWMPGPDELKLYDDVELPEPPTLFDDYSGRSSSPAQHEMGIGEHLRLEYDLKVTEPLSGKAKVRGPFARLDDTQRRAWDAEYVPKNEAFYAAKLSGRDLVRWKYQRYLKDYLRCVAGVDKNVGRLLDYLDETGLARNTIVVYSSDQGFYLGEHGWFDKRWMYEESFRMPLLVRWPGVTRAGSRVRALAQNLDFAPTLLDAAGVAVPGDMQGCSLKPLLQGHTPDDWRQSVYYHYYEYPAPHHVQAHIGVRTERYKLLYFYPVEEWELYDLLKDPHELHSVYAEPAYAPVRAKLKAELQRLREYYGDHTGPGENAPREFKNDAFDIGYRIADVKPRDGGWLVAASGDSGYLLRRCAKPFRRQVRLHCRLQTQRPDGVRNGMIALGVGKTPDKVLRCGVYIGSGQYVVLADGNHPVAAVGAPFDKNKVLDVTVTADLAARRLALTVDGTEVKAALPAGWGAISYVGYGVNQSVTQFTELEVSGD